MHLCYQVWIVDLGLRCLDVNLNFKITGLWSIIRHELKWIHFMYFICIGHAGSKKYRVQLKSLKLPFPLTVSYFTWLYTLPIWTLLNIFYSFLKIIPISSEYLKWAIHYTTVVKSKIYSSKSASYRFYSLHSSIMYSLFNDILQTSCRIYSQRDFIIFSFTFFLFAAGAAPVKLFLYKHNVIIHYLLKTSLKHRCSVQATKNFPSS